MDKQEDREQSGKEPEPVYDGDIVVQLFKSHRLAKRLMLLTLVVLAAMAVLCVVTIRGGRAKGYIVYRDANGRVTNMITDDTDTIYQAELSAFLGDFVGEFYNWDFGATLDNAQLKAKYAKLSRYFGRSFFQEFLNGSIDPNYVASIRTHRIIMRPGSYNLVFSEIKGRTAKVVIEVTVNLYEAGEAVSGQDSATATFTQETQIWKEELEVTRGERRQDNLYGLFITHYTDVGKNVVGGNATK